MGCFRCSGKSNKKLDEEIDNKNKNLNKQAVKKQLIAGIEQFPLWSKAFCFEELKRIVLNDDLFIKKN